MRIKRLSKIAYIAKYRGVAGIGFTIGGAIVACLSALKEYR